MELGNVSFEAGAVIDRAVHEIDVYTMTGEEHIKVKQPIQPDILVVFGLGKGFELGAGNRLMAKYSVLDERRYDTPMSIGVALEISPVQGGAGLLFSTHLPLGTDIAIRPIANVWFSRRTYRAEMDTEDTELADPNSNAEDTLFRTRLMYQGFDFPVGFELPINTGNDWALTPTVSFTTGIPMSIEVQSASCGGCLFGLDKARTGIPMSFYAGVRIQPQLRMNGQSARTRTPLPTHGSADEAQE
jgi:hypothetical protein